MDKKLYAAVLKLIDEVMEKESPGWNKKKAVILKQKSPLMDALEVDSLLALEIVSRVEKRFGIKLKEDDFVYFDRIERIVDLIERKQRDRPLKIKKKRSKNVSLQKNKPGKKNEKI